MKEIKDRSGLKRKQKSSSLVVESHMRALTQKKKIHKKKHDLQESYNKEKKQH